MTKRERIVVTSGKFDPPTLEEINFLRRCREEGDWLIVGLHSDDYLRMCNSGYIHTFDERKYMTESLRSVDEVFSFSDLDGTSCDLLKVVKFIYPHSDITFYTDQEVKGSPEAKVKGIKFKVVTKEI